MTGRCFTANLEFPTVLDALYHDWGRTALLVGIFHRQRSPESARLLLLVTLELLRIHRRWMRQLATL